MIVSNASLMTALQQVTGNVTAHVLEPVEKDMRPRLASSQTRACMPCIRCTCVCRDIKPQLDHRHEETALSDAVVVVCTHGHAS